MIYTLPEIVMVTKLQILWQKECVWFKYVALINLNGFIFNVSSWIHHWNLSNKYSLNEKTIEKKSIIHKYLENWSSLGKEALKGNSQYTCKFKY